MLINVELIPSTAFYKNIRSEFSTHDWDLLRRYVYREADYNCQICGGRGPNHPVECHELWSYNYPIQKIIDLVALCPACHECHHVGRAEKQGRLEVVTEHIIYVNSWTRSKTIDHIRKAFETWAIRSRSQWELDLSPAHQLVKELKHV